MNTELAPFTHELFQLLGLIKLPEISNAKMITPLKPWPVREKVVQKRRVVKKPGCIVKSGTKWTFIISYYGTRMQKGGFLTPEEAQKDMQRWLDIQIALRNEK